jgi:tRNA modification GTPase
VAIINKTDLPRASDIDCIRAMADETVEISATGGEGLKDLETAVSRVLGAAEFDPTAARLITERQRACCVRALNALDDALAALESGVTLDAVTVCADTAIEALLELTGEKASEAVVNEVFRRFCVGK